MMHPNQELFPVSCASPLESPLSASWNLIIVAALLKLNQRKPSFFSFEFLKSLSVAALLCTWAIYLFILAVLGICVCWASTLL